MHVQDQKIHFHTHCRLRILDIHEQRHSSVFLSLFYDDARQSAQSESIQNFACESLSYTINISHDDHIYFIKLSKHDANICY